MKQLTVELETLKEKNILKKYNSDSMAYRKYSGDQFKQTSGISPQEIESGAALNGYKYALGAVLAVYLKGLPIQSVTQEEKKGYTKVNFYDTPKGSFNVVNMANEMATNVEGPSLPSSSLSEIT